MKRRIIQLGGRTLLVSIPYQWASEHDITKGSEINITETPEGILVHTGNVVHSKERVHIDSRDVERLLRRTVLSAYTNGVYEVVVTHEPSEMILLQNLTKEFIGFDIVSQDNTKTIFQDFSTSDEKNVQQVFQRALMILKTMISEGREGVQKNDAKIGTTIQQLDVNLNRACNYCYRYSRKNTLPVQEAIVLQLVAHSLEKCGDIYKEIIQTTVTEKERISPILHEQIEKLLDKICSFTLKRNAKHALECADTYDTLKKSVLETKPTKITILTAQLLTTLIDIQSHQLGMIEEIKKE